jgi:hypothetical protein
MAVNWMYEDVRRMFETHSKNLFDQKYSKLQDIDSWRRESIKNIENHAFEQTNIINEEYGKQYDDLYALRQEIMNKIQTDTKSSQQNTNDMDHLLAKCASLKIELVSVQYQLQELLYMNVSMMELPSQLLRDQSNRNTDDRDKQQVKVIVAADIRSNTSTTDKSNMRNSALEK